MIDKIKHSATKSGNASYNDSAGELAIGTGTTNGAAGNSVEKANKVAADAAKAVGAITGADILRAIAIGAEGKAAKLAKNSAANLTSIDAKKDAVIAGGIALRAMAKGGKFANGDITPEIMFLLPLKE